MRRRLLLDVRREPRPRVPETTAAAENIASKVDGDPHQPRAAMDVAGSSESFATPVMAGAATASRHPPTLLMKSNTARELEGLSYRELADVMGVPLGSVMSGLSRARCAFRSALDKQLKRSGVPTGTYPRARPIISIGEYSRVSGD